MLKKFGFWLSVFFLLLTIVSLGFYLKQKMSDINPEEVIIKSSKMFKPKLKSFLKIVDATIENIEQKATYLDVDILPKDSLNIYFSRLIDEEEFLQGIVLLGSDIDYALVKDNKTWMMTHSLKNEFVDWFRLNDKLEVVTEWTNANNVVMDTNNLRSIKASALSEEGRIWLSTESDIAEKRDILFNIFKIESVANTDVVALIYRTSQLGQRFNQALTFDMPLVTLITPKRLVTPMRTSEDDKYLQLKNLSLDVNNWIREWQKTANPSPELILFETQKREYWLSIDTIAPLSGISAFSIAISQDDLLGSINKFEQSFIYAAIMFLLFSLFAYLTTYRKYKKVSAPDKSLKELSIDEVKAIIQGGETEFVEFKSSLRWDYNMQKVNWILEMVILKTIAAFTNASGGKLLIGVDDDFNVLGLEPDFHTLAKKNVDYFELHLRKLINNQFGVNFSNKYILTRFQIIEGRTICVVQIAPSDQPKFLKSKNKHGALEERFYVRSGNASQQITSLTEINAYIEGHFPKKV